MEGCITCDTIAGRRPAPGGLAHDDEHWAGFLRSRPALVPGQGFLALRRHREDLSELTAAELEALGPLMGRVAAYRTILAPARVHFGLYGEAVRHVHLHVLPRTADLPAGKVPVTLLHARRELPADLGVRRPFGDARAAVAGRPRREPGAARC